MMHNKYMLVWDCSPCKHQSPFTIFIDTTILTSKNLYLSQHWEEGWNINYNAPFSFTFSSSSSFFYKIIFLFGSYGCHMYAKYLTYLWATLHAS